MYDGSTPHDSSMVESVRRSLTFVPVSPVPYVGETTPQSRGPLWLWFTNVLHFAFDT